MLCFYPFLLYQTRIAGGISVNENVHACFWSLQCHSRDVKNSSHFCYVRRDTLIVSVWGMPWPVSGAIYFNAQFGFSDKGRSIKGLIVCLMLHNII